MSRYPMPNYDNQQHAAAGYGQEAQQGGAPQQGGMLYGQDAQGMMGGMAPAAPQSTAQFHQRPLPPEMSAQAGQQQYSGSAAPMQGYGMPQMYAPQAPQDVNSLTNGMRNVGLQDTTQQAYSAQSAPQQYPDPNQFAGQQTQYADQQQYNGQQTAYNGQSQFMNSQQSAYPPPNNMGQPQQPAAPATPQAGGGKAPRPNAVEKPPATPREAYGRMTSGSAPGTEAPPSTTTDFIGYDDGSANPKYLRLTVNSIPEDKALATKSSIPMGVVVTPFADPEPGEQMVPEVDLRTIGGGGPLRCNKCRAYANPGFVFIESGNRFVCNLCGADNETPTEHMCATDPGSGMRLDAATRHEFRFGSVDYIVGNKDYVATETGPAQYVLCIDVSAAALSTGLSTIAIQSLSSLLESGALPGAQNGAKVGIITFDQSLHFYDGRGESAMNVQYVPDIEEPFLPLGQDAFFQSTARAVSTLASITNLFSLNDPSQLKTGPPPSGNALGSALVAARDALAQIGGKVFVVTGGLPTAGIGKLERRGGPPAGEEREKALMVNDSPFYEELGSELAEKHISVDLLVATTQPYVDMAGLSRLPRSCGGRSFYVSNFDVRKDDVSVRQIIVRSLWGVRAFQAMVRVRASYGLETGEFMGSFGRPQRRNDVTAPVMGVDSNLAVELKYEGQMKGKSESSFTRPNTYQSNLCIQCAVLYTDFTGQRRIRVHTMFPPKTSVLTEVFRSADFDVVLSFMAMRSASAIYAGGKLLSKVREAIIEKACHMLFIYRKFCNPTSSPSSQLILPEALKIMPVVILGLLKSTAFRPQPSGQNTAGSVTIDERAAALVFLSCARPQDIVTFCYPRMYSLGEIPEDCGVPLPPPEGFPAEGEPIGLPSSVPMSSEFISEDKIMLVDAGRSIVVWMGKGISQELYQDVFETSLGVYRLRLNEEGLSDLGMRIAAVITRVLEKKTNAAQIFAAVAGDELHNQVFSQLVVEDKNIALGQNGWSYQEFLKVCHRRIMNKMAQERAQKELATWEMLGYQ